MKKVKIKKIYLYVFYCPDCQNRVEIKAYKKPEDVICPYSPNGCGEKFSVSK